MNILVYFDDENEEEIFVKEKDLKNLKKIIEEKIEELETVDGVYFKGDSIFEKSSKNLEFPKSLKTKKIEDDDKEYPIIINVGQKEEKNVEEEMEKKKKKRVSKVDIDAIRYNVSL